jgi:hypothetical protein
MSTMSSSRPQRYLVTFGGYRRDREYPVCTMQGEAKAVAVAASYHTQEHPRTPILTVMITPLGESSGDLPEEGDLADVNEWR